MKAERKKYDSTVARIAGNVLSGLKKHPSATSALSKAEHGKVEWAVNIARAIVAEVERTELEVEASSPSPTDSK